MRKSVATVGVDVVAAIARKMTAAAEPTAETVTATLDEAIAVEVPAETATATLDEAIAVEVPAAAEPSETPGVVVAVVPTAYRINAIPAAGFCRAGRRWFREGEEVNRQGFSDEQWAALTGEPMLNVVAL